MFPKYRRSDRAARDTFSAVWRSRAEERGREALIGQLFLTVDRQEMWGQLWCDMRVLSWGKNRSPCSPGWRGLPWTPPPPRIQPAAPLQLHTSLCSCCHLSCLIVCVCARIYTYMFWQWCIKGLGNQQCSMMYYQYFHHSYIICLATEPIKCCRCYFGVHFNRGGHILEETDKGFKGTVWTRTARNGAKIRPSNQLKRWMK